MIASAVTTNLSRSPTPATSRSKITRLSEFADTLAGMDDITPAAWAVLQAAHDLQGGDAEASIDTSAVRAAALALVGNTAVALDFRVPGGTYAGIEAQRWTAPDSAGYVAVDVGMAPATAPGHSAHVVDDDYGVRVTDEGRAALAARAGH